MTGNGTSRNRLRILTYMYPEVLLDTFALLRSVIENATGLEADLMVENRFTGPTPERSDPFVSDIADIMAIHSSDYLRMKSENYDKMELCPAAPVYKHPLTGDRPVYFSEIIIHSSNIWMVEQLWDYPGCIIANFFSNLKLHSCLSYGVTYPEQCSWQVACHSFERDQVHIGKTQGSHLNSIKMVKGHRAEAAAIDSTVLSGFLREHDDSSDKIISILSLGPLPIYPMLYNINLSNDLKQQITKALLHMHKTRSWASELNNVGITKYVAIDHNLYRLEESVSMSTRGMNINPAYY